jgi:NADH-quinone oxidoreductase E subunit
VDEYENLLNSNPIWKIRTQGVGFVPLEDLLDLGVTGPMIRAAGMKWDVRKDEPYSSYDQFDFEIPVHKENDVFARYRVRLEEMRQSARIIKQALEGMPEGAWQASAPKIVLPEREKMKTQMEALIYHFKIVTAGFRVPAGEAYQAVESPRGEIAYYIVSNGTSKPYRVFMRTPSFGNLQALAPLLEGRLLADSIASLGSMDFVNGAMPMTFSPELEARFAKLLESYPPGRTRSAVVPMLLYAQDEVGHISNELIEEVARRCQVKPLQVDEVVGYYSMLHRKPLGKCHVQVCTNISCLILGADDLYEHASKKLGIGHKEVTPDGQFSLEEVECMGACSWAPAIQLNYDFHHHVTPEKLDQLLADVRKAQ